MQTMDTSFKERGFYKREGSSGLEKPVPAPSSEVHAASETLQPGLTLLPDFPLFRQARSETFGEKAENPGEFFDDKARDTKDTVEKVGIK